MRKINRLVLILSLGVIASMATSCRQDDFSDMAGLTGDDRIRITAEIVPEQSSRAYYGSDQVENVEAGTFYFTYPRAGNEASSYTIYNLAYVDFGAAESPETGFVYYYNADKQIKDLTWRRVWNEGKTSKTFYLHNINPDWWSYGYTSNRYDYYQQYKFNDKSPYYASPLDKIEGKNDLMTGSVYASNSTANISFSLYHRLSLLKFNIEVYGSKSDDFTISLDNAEVSVSNLYTKLTTFNVYYPTTFSTSTGYSYNTITTRATTAIIDPNNEALDWEIKTISDYEAQDGEMYTKVVYEAQAFVFPPQTPTSSYWPVLTVKVPKEDVTGSAADKGQFVTYSSPIPDIMFNVDANGNTVATPIATSLSSGYQLTLTASINSPDTEMTFTPAKLEQWVSKSSYTITTKQAGIYTASDWDAMVAAYQSGDVAELLKYGYQGADGNYVIQLWAGITLDKSGVIDCMAPENVEGTPLPFSFMFNGYSVSLATEGEENEVLTGSPGQIALYNYVSGNDLQFEGIKTLEDLEEVIRLCQNPNLELNEIMQYGSINNADNSLTFDIDGSFDVDYEDIFQVFPSQLWYYNVSFNILGSNIVNVVISEEENVVLPCGSTGFNAFKRLAVKNSTYGIQNSSDFRFLTECYNTFYNYQPDILTLYGTQSTSGSWTFYFRASMSLNGSYAFLSMLPDSVTGEDNGHPNYSVSSSYQISFVDDLLPNFSVSGNNNTYLYPIFSGSGQTRNNTNLSDIVSYYNSKNMMYLWYYGRFENGEWIFPLTYSASGQYISYSTLYGKMVPDVAAAKYPYTFYIGDKRIQVRSMPQTNGVPNQSGSSGTVYFSETENGGAEALQQIALGTYWEWLAGQTAP